MTAVENVTQAHAAQAGADGVLPVHIGQWRHLDGAGTSHVHNPADTRELVATTPRASISDVGEALGLAAASRRSWAHTSPLERGRVIGCAADAMAARAEKVATDMTREVGKPIAESRAETLRAVDVLRYFAEANRHEFGTTAALGADNESAFTMRVPLGVVSIITPWNFPLVIPTWKVAGAMTFGNTVVVKPAEIAPLSAINLVECLLEGGVPAGALGLVLGRGSELGPELVSSAYSNAISFTGSTEVGRQLAIQAANCAGKPAQCEMGGRNAIIVMADADQDAAIDAVVLAGFGTAGQRCTSSSRVIIEAPIYEEFVERLKQAAGSLRVGPGLDPETDMGPLVSARQLDGVVADLERAREEGAEVLCGGGRLNDGVFEHGHFMQPTVTTAPVDSWFTNHEIFGPVITVYQADSFEDAIELNNGVPHGLSSGIFTSQLGHAHRFLSETDTGMAHVNRPTVGAEAHLPFGGAKDSSIGLPELGAARSFFTKNRSAHVRWTS